MLNAVKEPKSILLLGGTSDIGLAIIAAFSKNSPLKVILAARPNSASIEKATQYVHDHGAESVEVIDFDAEKTTSHRKVIDKAFSYGDIDIAIVAFGVLPDAEKIWNNQKLATQTATINYTAGVSVGILLAEKFQAQGHGHIIALSSVAGEVIRKSNFLYGSTKAGFDAFYRGLGYTLEPLGIHTLVVRSGQVRTKMTTGLEEAPLTVNPQQIAELVVHAVYKGKNLIWSPPLFRVIMSVFRHMPTKIFLKLPI